MPESIPVLTPDELTHWAGMTYRQLVYNVIRKFIAEEEIPSQDLKSKKMRYADMLL